MDPLKGTFEMADNRNIIAAIAAGGGTGAMAFYAPANTPSPAVAVAGTAGVQTVAVTGTATGGTFTLTWNGLTTTPIAYNATASAVQAALAALTGGSTIAASGGPLPTAVVVTFPARLRQVALTANGSALVGTTPAVTVTQTTPGTQSTPAAFAVPSAGAGWADVGWCDPKGLDLKSNISSTDIKGFGSFVALDTIVTEAKKTGDVTFLETNPVSLAVYNSLPLGSVTLRSDGSMSVATGAARATKYAAYYIFNNTNGSGSSFYHPSCLVTNQGDLTSGQGSVISRAVTVTCFPDAAGNSQYEEHVVANLAS